MPAIRRVIQYSGLSYFEVLKLPADTFLLMVKNHYVDELYATEGGREYLDKCKRLNTTEPEREKMKGTKK